VPHFSQAQPGSVELLFDDGLNAVALDGSGRQNLVQVTGPGYYFLPGRVSVDDLRLSPDGKWVLAQVAQQLHVLAMQPNWARRSTLLRPASRIASSPT